MFSKIYHHTFIIRLILLRLNDISVTLQYDQSDPCVIHVHVF
jgi:hypothetical protein